MGRVAARLTSAVGQATDPHQPGCGHALRVAHRLAVPTAPQPLRRPTGVRLAFHPTTMLYHSHYWRFEADLDGRGPKAIDLPRYLGRYPHLTHHKAHLYTGADGTAVLCLSHRVSGGMPTLETALVQTLKWADGTGEVVRGRPFPTSESPAHRPPPHLT